jgi:DNA-binding MarR family transcriptional regulator
MATKDETARQVWLYMNGLMHGGDNSERFPRIAAELSLTPGQMHTLLELRDGEPQPMRALADTMACDASYATTLIDGLERLGFVERRVSSTDRRVKLIHVTDDGRKMQHQIIERLSVPPPVLEELSVADLRALKTVLAKIAPPL